MKFPVDGDFPLCAGWFALYAVFILALVVYVGKDDW